MFDISISDSKLTKYFANYSLVFFYMYLCVRKYIYIIGYSGFFFKPKNTSMAHD